MGVFSDRRESSAAERSAFNENLNKTEIQADVVNSYAHIQRTLSALEKFPGGYGRRSRQRRSRHKADVRHRMRMPGIRSHQVPRQVDRSAVVHWRRVMELQSARPRTIQRRLSALSSFYTHLVDRRVVETNPGREVQRPPVGRDRCETRAFTTREAGALLEAPDRRTLRGLRDRALLPIGLQVGARRSEIAKLAVRAFQEFLEGWCLHFAGRRGEAAVAVNEETAARIREYLNEAGHGLDLDGPLLRPLRANGRTNDGRRYFSADMIDRVLKLHAESIGFADGFSARSMRATSITTALQNRANLEDAQRHVGHADPATTKLYDRRARVYAKSAASFASY